MSEEPNDDQSQSHYEVSLTAGQAFVAFVLMLLSLAASFAFGLMIGKGQADERLVVRKEPSVVTEAAVMGKKADRGKIVELGVAADDFKAPAPKKDAETIVTTTTTTEAPATITEAAEPRSAVKSGGTGALQAAAAAGATTPALPAETKPAPAAAQSSGPAYAQLLSTSDQKTAETLAAKLIDSGFTSAYVEHGTSEKGAVIFRVRVKFKSDAEARAAEPKLRGFSKELWITPK
jgi:cell division septation protein DedD